ncbi:MAG: hypothetical protein QOE14_2788 [Humisphaera sp.]|nr:hypothetical protein [Humisphaera sp.]
MIYANLLHLSYNMWSDWPNPEVTSPYYAARPYLRFDEKLWSDLLAAMKKAGLNMVVIDVGDGVKFTSHPEIAVDGAWSTDRMRAEVKRLGDMGLEPVPKLNFSTCHDHWLGPYARMVSTAKYYEVARDLIAETIDLFGKPRFFHLGMDEENERNQRHFEYAIIRQHDLWWRDFNFLVEQVEQGGSRAWIWSDYVWRNPDPFWAKMPQKVLQSNWYYGAKFGDDVKAVRTYRDLEDHGYDQVPTLSNWTTPDNIAGTVEYCRKHIKPERLKGFLLAPWRPTLPDTRAKHMQAIDEFGKEIKTN